MSTGQSGSRRLAWLAVGLVAWTVWVAGPAGRPSPAQQANEDKKAEQPPEAPSAPAAQPAPLAEERLSAFEWFIKSSGVVGLFILALSVYFVATVGRLFWELRIPVAVPPEIVNRCRDLLAQRNFKGIFEVVKADDSVFSRLLSTGIAELPNGLAEARDVMERVGESIHVEMEKRISVLAVLGTLGPMIGLVGTLMGMIKSFGEIAMGGTELNPARVAMGISMALVITLEGVSLSVPAIWFFSVFRNRVSVITTNAGVEADQFLRHFAHAARTKAPAAGTPVPASAASLASARTAPRVE
ncbi:MAG: MotA/TolQ/ExbB proton channel family protein [Thermoguttaceae bacterium]